MEVVDNFVVNFCFFSKHRNHYPPEESFRFKEFNNNDLDEILGTPASFFFNIGDHNFFSQHGSAGYAFWTRSFCLTENEINQADKDHNIALEILIAKVKKCFEEHQVTPEKIAYIKEKYDCRCEVLFMAPEWLSHAIPYKVKPLDLLFIAEHHMDFSFWPMKKNQILTLQKSTY